MASLATCRQRLEWTRGWLGEFRQTQDVVEDDYEVLDAYDKSPSSHGVISLSDNQLALSCTEVEDQASCVRSLCSQEAHHLKLASCYDDVDSRYTCSEM